MLALGCSSPAPVPAQNSALLLDIAAQVDAAADSASPGSADADATTADAPPTDAPAADAPQVDAKPGDATVADPDAAETSNADAAADSDAATPPFDTAADTMPSGPDSSPPDAPAETSQPDADLPDAGQADTSQPDAGQPDTAEPDGAAPDTPVAPPACVDAPPPAPVSSGPLATQSPAGAVETVSNGAFTDDYLLQGDGNLKVGVRRNWGASIIFYGFSQKPGLNTTNVIDANDTGREVQVALYDPARAMQGCAHNATCQTNPAASCPGSITYLGWNPVQGGNECNVGSPIESIGGQDGVLTAVVRPNHWNPDWQEPTCANAGCSDPAKKAMLSDVRYTQRLRFVQNNVVEIEMQVQNLAALDHAVTLQEFPTLYAAFGAAGTPNLKVLLDANGQVIPIDQPANDGFLFKAFNSPGGWASLQNAKQDYGVALYYENRTPGFQGWQKDGVFNNFRSQFAFGLPALGTVRARAYLVLGSFATVKAIITSLDAQLPPFGALDTPAAEQTVPLGQATVPLTGWALDNHAVAKVQARLDGQPWAELPLAVPRPDICTAWPGYAMCQSAVGFAASPTLPANLGACAHLLEIVATDSHGNSRVIGRTRLFTGGSKPPPPPAVPPHHPVYRFVASAGGDHMFGLTAAPQAGYVLEGTAFSLFDGPGTAAQPIVPIYQRYCAACTDHMPSLDPGEGAPDYTGSEVLGYCSPQPTSWAPTKLTRLYSAAASDHFLTADPGEVTGASGYSAEWSCWGP
ncbi:MAG: hypothetical protein HY902_20855 [Deltaproteobacteria bacterium]|nr:hypothetical protein [Deltaproteobacteria bacterium]